MQDKAQEADADLGGPTWRPPAALAPRSPREYH
jgi:hypothetical protein